MAENWLVLLVAAFCGGALNAAAGGGTFLTLPALMLVGVPSVTANATGTTALLPGYASSAWGFREELTQERTFRLWPIVIASLAGGALGSLLLLVTSNKVFRDLVPWLMLLGTLWFALWPLIKKRFHRAASAGTFATLSGIFAISIYGGYFNGGLGIILLALLSVLGVSNLNLMNGLKNLVSAMLTVIAVIIYALGGAVVWRYGVPMMAAAAIGGYAGARWAKRIPEAWLRSGIVFVGLVMTVVFFLDW